MADVVVPRSELFHGNLATIEVFPDVVFIIPDFFAGIAVHFWFSFEVIEWNGGFQYQVFDHLIGG